MIDRSRYSAALFAVGLTALALGGCQGGAPGALSAPLGAQTAGRTVSQLVRAGLPLRVRGEPNRKHRHGRRDHDLSR